MEPALILGTTFLLDLEREALDRDFGPAHRFLEENRGLELCITLTTAGELAAGPRMDERSSWDSLVGHFRVLIPDLDTAWA